MRTAQNRRTRCVAQPATIGQEDVDPDAREYELSIAGLVALLEHGSPVDSPWSEDRDDAAAYDREVTAGICRPYVGAGQ